MKTPPNAGLIVVDAIHWGKEDQEAIAGIVFPANAPVLPKPTSFRKREFRRIADGHAPCNEDFLRQQQLHAHKAALPIPDQR